MQLPLEPSASVILLREGRTGPQVFLMRRAKSASTYGGSYVFPGGKVDPGDGELAAEALDLSPAQMAAALGETGLTAKEATAIHVAAVRELFEEAGVLLAEVGEAVGSAGDSPGSGTPFNAMLARLNKKASVSKIAPWSRWITPVIANSPRRRFDTRFFVARMPVDQTASAASTETTDGLWLSPRLALERYWDRAIDLSMPQIMTLAHLDRFASADDAYDAARRTRPSLVLPVHLAIDGVSIFCLPGDAQHPLSNRAMPGATRLAHRNDRFEPLDGFEAYFSSGVDPSS
jgi:8-oxo-dGTP pyrophosphatase MutT (NUDIX family)